MSTYGIIAEYNPLHKGHIYQIEKIKNLDKNARLIVAMSGNYTQRGTPAIMDKWTRAKHAIKNGVNLVLEIPTIFATKSAQFFAEGGISLLSRLRIVEHLSFGMESDSLSQFSLLPEVMETKEFQETLSFFLAKKLPYQAAITKTFATLSDIEEETLTMPNNILAIEYIKALKKYNSTITPLPHKRQGNYKKEELSLPFSSASSIRSAFYTSSPQNIPSSYLKKVLPLDVFNDLLKRAQNDEFPNEELLFRLIIEKILFDNANKFSNIYGMNEGLDQKLIKAAKESKSLAELIDFARGKRYPTARIKRLILFLLLSLTKEKNEISKNGTLYVRPLAFDTTGKELLHEIKNTATIPIVNKIPDFLNNSISLFQKEMLLLDIKSTDYYALTQKKITLLGADYKTSPIFIR